MLGRDQLGTYWSSSWVGTSWVRTD